MPYLALDDNFALTPQNAGSPTVRSASTSSRFATAANT
jgi:hypothetical protein